MRVGLIGEKLGHSFSKEIHEQLTSYQYDLIELSQEEFHSFMKEKLFDAINVTIPYKQAVIPYLDMMDEKAKKIGAVNAIKNVGGKLIGTNTDYDGLKLMIERHFNLENEVVLICGSGATSKTAMAVVQDLNPKEIIQVSRNPRDHMISYAQVNQRKDITFIINTTSVGMSPKLNASVVDVTAFPCLKGVIDVVYNPLCTKLCYDASLLGIKAISGLEMLVGQAIVAIEFFLDQPMDLSIIQKLCREIELKKRNKIIFENKENIDCIELTDACQVEAASLMQGQTIFVNCQLDKEELMRLMLNGVVGV